MLPMMKSKARFVYHIRTGLLCILCVLFQTNFLKAQSRKIDFDPSLWPSYEEELSCIETYSIFYKVSVDCDSIGLETPKLDLMVNDSVISLSADGLSIVLADRAFKPEEHLLEFETLKSDVRVLYKIDSLVYYGSYDIDTPATELVDLTCMIHNRKIAIPKTAYSDLYDPLLRHPFGSKFQMVGVYRSLDRERLYLKLNSISSGYEVIFIIDGFKYIGRVLWPGI